MSLLHRSDTSPLLPLTPPSVWLSLELITWLLPGTSMAPVVTELRHSGGKEPWPLALVSGGEWAVLILPLKEAGGCEHWGFPCHASTPVLV